MSSEAEDPTETLLPQTTDTIADIHLLDSVTGSPAASRGLYERLETALEAFPELRDRTVTVGMVRPGKDYIRKRPVAHADPYNDLIHVRREEPTSNVTLYHELGHLAIYRLGWDGENVPTTSEEFCTIFSTARMPPAEIDSDRLPYLGEPSIQREGWPYACLQALRYRENNRDYIQHCSELLGIGDDRNE